MSNLLNNNKPKKKLLDRGPKIVPAQEFKLEEVNEETPSDVQEQLTQAEQAPAKKRNTTAKITSVRVTKATRNKLNTLIQLGKADSVDVLLDHLLDEYIQHNLAKDEQKTFDLIFDVIQKRDR